jgi:AraC-like DNA-binding protein
MERTKSFKKWPLMNKRVQKYREQVYTYSPEHQPVAPPIRVTVALVSRWGPGDRFERVNRPVPSFNLVTKGNGLYWQNGKHGRIRSGELFIAHKGEDQIFETGEEGFLHKRTILVEGIGLDALMQVTGLGNIHRVTFESSARVTNLFRRCYRLLREKPSGFAAELSVLAYAIINECCQSGAAKYPFAVRAAIEYMEQNLKGNPSLPTIAAAAGLSVRHCIRLFRLHLHDSPLSFFTGLKINAAKAMLMHSELSIKQIGAEVGYDDQFHFSAQFKRRTGQSPRAFRSGYQSEKHREVV